jgi:hypothetical protein
MPRIHFAYRGRQTGGLALVVSSHAVGCGFVYLGPLHPFAVSEHDRPAVLDSAFSLLLRYHYHTKSIPVFSDVHLDRDHTASVRYVYFLMEEKPHEVFGFRANALGFQYLKKVQRQIRAFELAKMPSKDAAQLAISRMNDKNLKGRGQPPLLLFPT